MDPVTMVFYGVICGGLAVASPVLRKPWLRVVVGILVGVLAASALPFLRKLFGL